MKKCVACGQSGLKKSSALLDFNAVALVEGTVFACPGCGERYEGFERVELLSRTVAQHIARRNEPLRPEEICFLRKYLGYSGKGFANFLGVAPETVSRWESPTSPKPMQHSTELLLRYMALNERPISDYGLDNVGTGARKSKRPKFTNRKGKWQAA